MGAPGLAGRLLVATPLIGDPHFARTVVLLLAHTGDGAFGVVLNRPSETLAAELVPGWGERAAEPAVMFLGGPVGPNGVIGLHADGAVDLNVAPEHHVDAPATVRLFAGSAGWGAGQLESELAEQAWWTVDPAPDDAFSDQPETLWSRVLRRQAQPASWFAVYPPDPILN